MKSSKALSAFARQAREEGAYWTERAKLDFAQQLENQRRRSKLTYSQLAHLLGHSAAYVSKVFRGDANVTIESMVKLADAAGGRVQITIVDQVAQLEPWGSWDRCGEDVTVVAGTITEASCTTTTWAFRQAA
jgi:ribosome-binding protein aMBF1 (putative translation factor)